MTSCVSPFKFQGCVHNILHTQYVSRVPNIILERTKYQDPDYTPSKVSRNVLPLLTFLIVPAYVLNKSKAFVCKLLHMYSKFLGKIKEDLGEQEK